MNGNTVVEEDNDNGSKNSSSSGSSSGGGEKDQDLLKGVSFKIEPGQNVAIVGPSGSGKSTTLKLITRMIDPTEGEVYIDDIDARDVSLSSLRERIAVVPQDTCLFDDSILHNICYGNAAANPEAIESVIKDTGLSSTIEKFKDGILTKVGERGNRLSGGERQRISIARALLKDPSIILCDEVTSAVDAFAERDITDALRLATEKRSTVTVAHRLSSIVHCDTIIVLEKGRVVQQGTHKELLQDPDGTYARMWAAQIGDVCNVITTDD
jgi:ATP-binding cassette subfamily B protein